MPACAIFRIAVISLETMNTVVQKFGGTSVGSADIIRHAGNRVQDARSGGDNVAVVVSAANTTDNKKDGTTTRLTELADIAFKTDSTLKREVNPRLQTLLRSYANIIDQLGLPAEMLDPHADRLYALLGANSGEVRSANGTKNHESMNERRVIAWGEEAMADIFARSLVERGMDAVVVDSRTLISMQTKNNSRVSRVDLPQTYQQIAALLPDLIRQGKIPVIPGYYGADKAGNTMLMSRGASDFTASLIAAGLDGGTATAFTHAQVDLCKEVPGVLRADPRLINNPPSISNVSHREIFALGKGGSQVVHHEAMQPLWKGRSRPINMRIVETQSGRSETLISGERTPGLKAISSRSNLRVLRVTGPDMEDATGVFATIAKDLAHYNVLDAGTENASMSISVDGFLNEVDADKVRRQLPGCEVEVIPDCASIVLVGNHMHDAVHALMSTANDSIHFPTGGPNSFTVVVPKNMAEQLVRTVYQKAF